MGASLTDPDASDGHCAKKVDRPKRACARQQERQRQAVALSGCIEIGGLGFASRLCGSGWLSLTLCR